jgi:hypothetical protein
MITLDYNEFITNTGSFSGSWLSPSPYRDYAPLYSAVSNLDKSDPIITFSNFPENLKIVDYNLDLPFDRVWIDLNFGEFTTYDFSYISGSNNRWLSEIKDPESYNHKWMAAYTSGGYWALGASGSLVSPGVLYTGSGNINSNILDITWQAIAIEDDTLPAPAPFQSLLSAGGPSNPTVYPEEPMIDYEVINDYTIRILTDIDTLAAPLRKLYIQFSGIE